MMAAAVRALSCAPPTGICGALHMELDGAVLLALILLLPAAGCWWLLVEQRGLLGGLAPRRCGVRVVAAALWVFLLVQFLPSSEPHPLVSPRPTCDGMRFVPPASSNGSLPTLGVVAVFRNEEHSLPEWLESLRAEGASEFALIDDNSTDASRAVIRAFKRKHRDLVRVTVTDRAPGVAQSALYGRAARHAQADWLAFVDLDEYVYARGRFATITEYLAAVPGRVSMVFLQWKTFGSGGRVDPPPSLIGGYLCRGGNQHEGKSLVRRVDLELATVHRSSTKGVCVNADLSCCDFGVGFTSQEHFPLHLNHYQNQALEVFEHTKLANGLTTTAMNARFSYRAENVVSGIRPGIFYGRDASNTGVVDAELARKRGVFFASARERALTPTDDDVRDGLQWVAQHCRPPMRWVSHARRSAKGGQLLDGVMGSSSSHPPAGLWTGDQAAVHGDARLRGM